MVLPSPSKGSANRREKALNKSGKVKRGGISANHIVGRTSMTIHRASPRGGRRMETMTTTMAAMLEDAARGRGALAGVAAR